MFSLASLLLRASKNSFFRKEATSLSTCSSNLLDLTLGNRSLATTASFYDKTSGVNLPIGQDSFGKIIRNKLDFVDKSLLIRDVVDDSSEVIVVTRPRRFGKTINLSMLQHYFATEAFGESTEGLFNGMRIMKAGEKYLQHHRAYPVILVSFKDVKDHRYENTYAELAKLMSELYTEHQHLLDSPNLGSHQKKSFQNILDKKATEDTIKYSLRDLTEYLYRVHKIRPWLLIDEYDTPIQSGYVHKYYDHIIELMRGILSPALKSNPYLHKAVVTGILRVAKESLFSGLNNLTVYSLLHPRYSEYFGFTEVEVSTLAEKCSLKSKLPEIRDWYNGYQIGNTTLYNPWSIVNCMRDKQLKPYWVNTSDNQLIKDILLGSSEKFRADFEVLLRGEALERIIDENSVFSDFRKNEGAAWNLLLMTGYLKVIRQENTDQGVLVVLKIPNHEVKNLYRKIIEEWLSNGYGVEWYNTFLNHLLTGNIPMFENDLKHIMEHTVSIHDTSRDPEVFYHGIMVGLTASLYSSKNYILRSNRESGYGRYDYMIFSRDTNKLTIILEFKKISSVDDIAKLEVNLKKSAKEALTQINAHHYLSEAERLGSTRVLKIGLAFCGKRFAVEHEIAHLSLTPTAPSKIKR